MLMNNDKEDSEGYKLDRQSTYIEDIVYILKVTYKFNNIHDLYNKLGIKLRVDTELEGCECLKGKNTEIVINDKTKIGDEYYLSCLLGHSILHNIGGVYKVNEATKIEEEEAKTFGVELYLDSERLFISYKNIINGSEDVLTLVSKMSLEYLVSEEIMYERLYELNYIRFV